jgi:thiamine pyrophosphate-dependent acetolactate synthase large subunit-like protein
VAALLGSAPGAGRAAPVIPPRAPKVMGDVLSDRHLLQRMAALRPAGSIIVEEAPSSRGAMHDYLPILEPDTFHTCASGGLGHGLPAAVGVALARPDARVIALLGDGSAMYSIQGLWSAAQLKLPVAFIIVNNRSYRALEEFGRRFAIDALPGVALPDIDFCRLAQAQGVKAIAVERLDELDAALNTVFATTEPIPRQLARGIHIRHAAAARHRADEGQLVSRRLIARHVAVKLIGGHSPVMKAVAALVNPLAINRGRIVVRLDELNVHVARETHGER